MLYVTSNHVQNICKNVLNILAGVCTD